MKKHRDSAIFLGTAAIHYWAVTFGPLKEFGFLFGFLLPSLIVPALLLLVGGLQHLEGRLSLKVTQEEFKSRILWRVIVLIIGLYAISAHDGFSCGSNYGQLLFSFACEESGAVYHNAIRVLCLYGAHHTVATLFATFGKLKKLKRA